MAKKKPTVETSAANTPIAKKPIAKTLAAKAATAQKPAVTQAKAGPTGKAKPAPRPKLVAGQAADEARDAAFSILGSFAAHRAGSAAPEGDDPSPSSPPSAAIASLSDLNGKLITAFRANAEATLDHVQAMANVRSVSQLLELNGRFVRDQLLAFNAQAKAIAAASLEFAHEAAKPPREKPPREPGERTNKRR